MGLSMIAYIYGSVDEMFLGTCKTLLEGEHVTYIPLSEMHTAEHDRFSHFMVSGTLGEIKEVFAFAQLYETSVGIVPLPTQKNLIRTFALSSKIEESITLAKIPAEQKIDLLYCNDDLVVQEVVIGDAPPLDTYDTALGQQNIFNRIQLFFHILRKVRKLRHTRITLTDENEQETKVSAVGLVGVEYQNGTFASKLITSQINAADGKLSLLILAPLSMLQYMGYLFRSLVSRWKSEQLPRSLGYIRSSKLEIKTERPLEVLVDSEIRSETPVLLRSTKESLRLSVGKMFWEKQSKDVQGKNSFKIDHLPSDEESASYLAKAIPLFNHASQAQYAALFSSLREEGQLNSTFMILLILATMIATFGLFINSSSVIIGAMLLAPLMQPIISLSMGVLRQDSALELSSAKTIVVGVLSVLLTAALIAWFIPMEKLTSEMSGRLFPTTLDLFIAIASGVAAAYAKSNEKISGSLAGVAIAVALVPPIAVAGVGLGWTQWHMFSSAFLLFMTNLIGIVLAAALTFVVLGYSPLRVAKKGILTWFMIAAFVSIPLYSSFEQMKENIAIQKSLSNIHFTLNTQEVVLTHIQLIEQSRKLQVRCEVIASGRLSAAEKKLLKEVIEKTIGRKADVIATFRYRL
ncbi:TIGR00341 family protein [Sulfurovum sp.]|uniref:TIGR00341 family protein n=1 Tax=Sulfurovum sp. TaxID=1969726 RepID=UPI0025FFE1C3|nr:TIGR00341 family protein [Sulfurovum sp.]